MGAQKLLSIQIDKIRGWAFLFGKSYSSLRNESDVENSCRLLPCKFRTGYYGRKTLRMYVKRCSLDKSGITNTTRPQSDGHRLMAVHFGPNDPLRTYGVLDTLTGC